MNFELTRLNSNIDKCIDINIDYEFSEKELENTELLDLNCHIEGIITKNSLNELYLDCTCEGVMVIPCAVTLKPTNYPFSIEISGNIDEIMQENIKNYKNSIDIFPIIWENILMEIPMRVVSEEAKDFHMEGNGWKFSNEEEEKISSPFDELKDLL